MALCPKDGLAVPCPALIARPRTAPVACSSAQQRGRWALATGPVAGRGYPHDKPTGRPAVVLQQRQRPSAVALLMARSAYRWHDGS
jgi:hypothetical protein